MVYRHHKYHSLIPIKNLGYLPPQTIYRACAREAYTFCFERNLRYLWAYLWEHWYRPARWMLWARSAYHKVPKWATNMAIESQWRVLKRDKLTMGRRVALPLLVRVISEKMVAHLEENQKELEKGRATQNFRYRTDRWRGRFKADVRVKQVKRNRTQAEAQLAAEQQGQGQGWVSDALTSDSDAGGDDRFDSDDIDHDDFPSGPRVRPSLQLQPSLAPTATTRPSLTSPKPSPRPPLAPRPNGARAPTSPPEPALTPSFPSPPYFTDRNRGVCGRSGYLLGRYLFCWHLLPDVPYPSYWFANVERHREPPFYRLPPNFIPITSHDWSEAKDADARAFEGMAKDLERLAHKWEQAERRNEKTYKKGKSRAEMFMR
ncbi:hypothetical protein MNV49_006554 [Pseudohyphozyma bogoriensis]|nr:hypothetical protein MNV49_006554 [Pseudohyphozyma bogoriensis]